MASATARVRFTTPLWKAFWRRRAITVAMQSWEGIPFGSGRNAWSHARLARPKRSTSTHESAPQITPHSAIVTIGDSEMIGKMK